MPTTSLFEFREKYIQAALAALNALDLATATQTDLMIHGNLLKTLDTVGASSAASYSGGGANTDFVGVAYDTVNRQWMRLGSATGLATGALPASMASLGPVFSRLRRVVLADAGTVYAGISWANFATHDDGTAVDLSGANGQIMVEYLPAWYKVGMWGNWQYILLSHLPLEGFTLYPLFTGKEAAYRGAYEASAYDYAGTVKLCSIAKSPADGVSAVYPVTTRAGDWGHAGLTTSVTDTLALARGAGWRQSHLLSALWERLLMIVAYGSYNIPGIVGVGRINLSGGDWLNDSYIGKCGLGDVASGYASAVQAGAAAGYLTDYAQVLGVENPWGNVWERVASLVSDGALYYKDPPYDYTLLTDWTRLLDAAGQGIDLPKANGYGGRPHSGLGMVLPADLAGSSAAGMYDYSTYAGGLRVLRVGGSAGNGAVSGPFCWSAYGAASFADAGIGGRLCFERDAPA